MMHGCEKSDFVVVANSQLPLPQAQRHAVAAAAIRGDQQPRRAGKAGGTELYHRRRMLSTEDTAVSWADASNFTRCMPNGAAPSQIHSATRRMS